MRRFVLLFIGGGFLSLGPFLSAETASWKLEKQFSADVTMVLKSGNTHAFKLYFDAGKQRFEFSGLNMVQIVRPDERKFYSLMPAQKMCIEMPFAMSVTPDHVLFTSTNDAKFELIGPDSINGATLTKYKMIVPNGHEVYYWWIEPATLVPIRVSDESGSFTMSFKNYKAELQDASVFDPPAGYQLVQMPVGTSTPSKP